MAAAWSWHNSARRQGLPELRPNVGESQQLEDSTPHCCTVSYRLPIPPALACLLPALASPLCLPPPPVGAPEKLPCYGGEMELSSLEEISADAAGASCHMEQQVGEGGGAAAGTPEELR